MRDHNLFENLFVENPSTRLALYNFSYISDDRIYSSIKIREISHIRGPFLVFKGTQASALDDREVYFVIDVREKKR